MKQNPRMRVMVLTGRRDLAVPEDSMRYSIAHMPHPEEPAGKHRVSALRERAHDVSYRPDAEKLRKDLTQFITEKPGAPASVAAVQP